MTCTYILSDQKQCQAKRMKNALFCFRHNPETKEQALKASQTGGSNRTPSVAFSDELQIATSHDIEFLLAKVISGVWKGEVPIKVATTIGFLSRCWIEAHEKNSIEKRIELLEKQIASEPSFFNK